MPRFEDHQRTLRAERDTRTRSFVVWMFDSAYVYAVLAIIAIAAGFAIYAFTLSFQDGARSVLCFIIPAMWGAYALAVNDGRPSALEEMGEQVTIGLGVFAALVLAGVLFAGAPVFAANAALGAMTFFFFLMWVSDAPSPYVRRPSERNRIWGKTILVMVTVFGLIAAAAL